MSRSAGVWTPPGFDTFPLPFILVCPSVRHVSGPCLHVAPVGPSRLANDAMPRAAFAGVFVTAILLGAVPGGLRGQTVEDPLVPRGSLVFRAHPTTTNVTGVYVSGDPSTVDLGEAFQFSGIGAQQIPSLAAVDERFRTLSGSDEASPLTLGATSARFSLDERVLPLHLGFGLLDRLTVGVTVPFVRKRLQPFLRLDPDGANVGRNPSASSGSGVAEFLGEADAALNVLGSQVDATCSVAGEDAPECQEGRSLVSDASGFLAGLAAAYDQEQVFPLVGSTLGTGISGRWTSLSARFDDWGTEAPATDLPLASDPLTQSQFESLYLAPAWGGSGFPLEAGESVLGLGDVEAHVALGLMRPDGVGGGAGGMPRAGTDGVQIVASAVGIVRFATGTADSLQTLAPFQPPRGVSGVRLRAVTDLLLPGRFAVLGMLETGWNGSVETTVLAPDPGNVFRPDFTRMRVRWSPGSHVQAGLVPRYRLAPGLSVGAGWHLLRRDPDEYEPMDGSPLEPGGPALPVRGQSYTQHRLGLELRYAAMRAPMAEQVWFPFEVMLRASRSIAGSAGAPVETKAEAMVRFRLRDW